VDERKGQFNRIVHSLKNLVKGEELFYLDSWFTEFSIRIVLGNREHESDILIYLSPFIPPPSGWLIIQRRDSLEKDPVVIRNWEAMESDWIPESLKLWIISNMDSFINNLEER
jgi:hypothetical protein